METNRADWIWQGVIAGVIGYAVVALLVGAMDVLQGRSFFFTASLLGEWLFYDLKDPAHVVIWPGAVFARGDRDRRDGTVSPGHPCPLAARHANLDGGGVIDGVRRPFS